MSPRIATPATKRPDDPHYAAIPSFLPKIDTSHEKTDKPWPHTLTNLHKYRFWSPNAHRCLWVLGVDLDRPDAIDHLYSVLSHHDLAAPSYVIQKAENGHVQAGWFIEGVSTGPNSRAKPQQYAHAVRQALTNAFGSDQGFVNSKMWNPFWSGWSSPENGRIYWGITDPRPLSDLRGPLIEAQMWNPYRPNMPRVPRAEKATDGDLRPVSGRNVSMFNQARLRASGTVLDAANAANATFENPLPQSEVNDMARSIEGYEALHGQRRRRAMTDEERAQQAARGAVGGSRKTPAQQTALAKGPRSAAVVRHAEATGRHAQIRALREQGWTQARIADHLGVSKSTIKRALRTPI